MGLFKFIKGRDRSDDEGRKAIPTVRSTTTDLSSRVQEDVRTKLEEIPDIDASDRDFVYDAALRSVAAGRDISSLSQAILERGINDITKKRAEEISRLLHNVATATLTAERQISLGITVAVWLYSGAPCMANPKSPTSKDRQQDAAHQAANGRTYEVGKGMLLAGVWTLPGREEGCRCCSKSLIPGVPP